MNLLFIPFTQLASLIKNKKISSVELTKFFIDRLKKWGDTLNAVITLTEDLALQQAKQADDDIKKRNLSWSTSWYSLWIKRSCLQ